MASPSIVVMILASIFALIIVILNFRVRRGEKLFRVATTIAILPALVMLGLF